MRPTAVMLLALLACGGAFGGALLLAAPDGRGLGLRIDMLPGWYHGDFAGAGILLLIGFAIALVVAAAVLPSTRPRAGWLAVLLVGAGLVAWVLLQTGIIGLILPLMQITFAVAGLVLVALGAWGSVRPPRADGNRAAHAS